MTADHKQAIAKELAYVRGRTLGLAARAGLKHEADDIASAVLVGALASVDRFDGANLRGWLLAFIRGEIANRRRHSSNRLTQPLETTGPNGETRLAVNDGVEGGQEHSVMMRELDAALTRLPPEQAVLVRLITIDGGSLEEAARTLGIPIGTVKSRLSRGLAELRHQLNYGPRTSQTPTARQPRPRRSRTTGSAPEGSRPGVALLSTAA